MPKMIVVAGPPGGGKSTVFGEAHFKARAIPYFNIDARCKELHGSAQQIPAAIRKQANDELTAFCRDHLSQRRTFAFETTLRADFAIRMAAEAHAAGFGTEMHYISAPLEMHIER